MKRLLRLELSTLLTIAAAAPAQPQAVLGAPWDSVGNLLCAPGTAGGGVYRYTVPRTDLTVRVGDVVVSPALALGSWAAFGTFGADTVVMGDLVVTAAELGPALRQLAADGIAVTAIHNHLSGENPPLKYVHFMGRGRAFELATKVRHALERTGAPLPARAALPAPVTIDTALVFRALGVPGRASGPVVQLSLNFLPGGATLHGHPLPAALGYGSPINLQAVSARRAVATGDFAVVGAKVEPILQALARHGIVATAVHSHLINESPTLYYIHFWADGALPDVVRGLRAAIDAAR